jgi:hypothetical protein
MTRTQRLQNIWANLNTVHFGGKLQPVPIRITRSRRTYGYFNGPSNGGRGSIRISTVMADTPGLIVDTILHEMIHQHLHAAAVNDWEAHGPAFQTVHERIFGHLYEEPA